MAIATSAEVMRARQHYIDSVRMKVGAVAGFAYTLPGSPTRTRLMHAPFGEVAEEMASAYAPVADLETCAARTPFGFARFWGRIKAAPLLDLPMLLDACEDDLSPQ